MKTKESKGWGIRVGGPRPYLAGVFHWTKAETVKGWEENCFRPVRVVLLPLADYRRLKRMDSPW